VLLSKHVCTVLATGQPLDQNMYMSSKYRFNIDFWGHSGGSCSAGKDMARPSCPKSIRSLAFGPCPRRRHAKDERQAEGASKCMLRASNTVSFHLLVRATLTWFVAFDATDNTALLQSLRKVSLAQKRYRKYMEKIVAFSELWQVVSMDGTPVDDQLISSSPFSMISGTNAAHFSLKQRFNSSATALSISHTALSPILSTHHLVYHSLRPRLPASGRIKSKHSRIEYGLRAFIPTLRSIGLQFIYPPWRLSINPAGLNANATAQNFELTTFHWRSTIYSYLLSFSWLCHRCLNPFHNLIFASPDTTVIPTTHETTNRICSTICKVNSFVFSHPKRTQC
jgi:hypothetical protein